MSSPEFFVQLIAASKPGQYEIGSKPINLAIPGDRDNHDRGLHITDLRNQIVAYIETNLIDLANVAEGITPLDPVLKDLVTEITKQAYELALDNRGLIGLVLNKFRQTPYTKEDLKDLRQVGWDGLFKAALIYDPQDNKFSTIAVPYIQGAMFDYQPNLEPITLPRYTITELATYSEVQLILTQLWGREPNDREMLMFMYLKNDLGYDPSEGELAEFTDRLSNPNSSISQKFQKYVTRLHQVRSAHQTTSLSDDNSADFRDPDTGELTSLFGGERYDLSDTIADPEEDASVEGSPDPLKLAVEVAKAFERLNSREREVLALKFGLLGKNGHTLQEIADLKGVNLNTIRQIEAKALRKLRQPNHSQPLRDLSK